MKNLEEMVDNMNRWGISAETIKKKQIEMLEIKISQ